MTYFSIGIRDDGGFIDVPISWNFSGGIQDVLRRVFVPISWFDSVDISDFRRFDPFGWFRISRIIDFSFGVDGGEEIGQ